ncbi:STAS domain-containing protein [Nibricoccus sp. IMCC34717]|uniref:STAS domain-containing protein n=1 Tax=Nibricoccus sp. IMCC34717 TaxID=3034021 RepID=UPI003850C69A
MQHQVTKRESGVTHVVLTGRLDLDAALQLENPFAFQVATEGSPVVVDLTAVDFVASMGMRLIVKNARAVHNRGGRLTLCCPNALIREAFTIAGLHTIVPLHESYEAAAADALGAAKA